MRHTVLAAALLIAPLAACGYAGNGEPSAPASQTATGAAAVPETPADTPTPAPTDPDAADTCGADKLGRWLNVLPTDDVKAGIAAAVGERAIRYYTEGDPITMDFSETRLNVELGADGRIKQFRCG